MKNLLLAVAVGALLWLGYEYLRIERATAWQQGYSEARAIGSAAIEQLQREYADAQAEQARLARQQLQQAIAASHTAERQYLHEQQQLQAQLEQLQEQLDAAYTTHYKTASACRFDSRLDAAYTTHYRATQDGVSAPVPVPGCIFTAGWLRDYNAALGVPGAVAAFGGAGGADAAPWPSANTDAEYSDAGITHRDLLQHAGRYGQWCRTNTQRLTALQQLIQQHQERSDGF